MFADKNELQQQLIQSLDDGTLISAKHDKSSLGTPESAYKTVVIPDEADLKTFLDEGKYSAKLYKNNNPNHSDPYVVIAPDDTSYVSASGVPPMSPNPTHPCDVFVAVSGVRQGLHLYGEESSKIATNESNGNLTFLSDLL